MDAYAVKDGKFALECTWQTLLCDGRSVILSARLIHSEYNCLGKSFRALARQTKYLARETIHHYQDLKPPTVLTSQLWSPHCFAVRTSILEVSWLSDTTSTLPGFRHHTRPRA